MSGYAHPTQGQRYQIEALLKAGRRQAQIAEILGDHKSTISLDNIGHPGSLVGMGLGWAQATESVPLYSNLNSSAAPAKMIQRAGRLTELAQIVCICWD